MAGSPRGINKMQIDWFVRGVLGNDDARYRSAAVCTFNMTRDESITYLHGGTGSPRDPFTIDFFSDRVVKKQFDATKSFKLDYYYFIIFFLFFYYFFLYIFYKHFLYNKIMKKL